MRTLLVNPTKPKARSRAKSAVIVVRNAAAPKRRKRRNADLLANPSKRRAPARVVVVANPRRKRRRNPSAAGQLIIPNPRYGTRRRRRNPEFSWMNSLKSVAIGGGTGLASYLVNRYAIANIGYKPDQHWNSVDNRKGVLVRSAIRFVLGGVAAAFLPGSIGAGLCSSMTYPAWFELHNWFANRDANTAIPPQEYANPNNPFGQAPAATSADLLEADMYNWR